MTQATSDYLNCSLRSKEDMADDLEYDVTRLIWLLTAMRETICQYQGLTGDYPFLGDATVDAAQKEIGAVEAKIAELKERIATLRGTP